MAKNYGRENKRPMTRNYKKVDKDLIIRGGFVPSIPKTATPERVMKTVGASLGSGPDPVSRGRDFVATMAKAKTVLDVAGKTIDVVAQAKAMGQSGDTTAVSETTVSGIANPNSAIGRKFKTKFMVGQKPTRIVNEKGRLNGTRKITQYDTQVQDTVSTGAQRQSLTMTTGANQKSFYGFDERSYWTLNDLEGLVDAASYSSAKNHAQIVYWMTKYFGTRITMMNTNKYLKMRVRVHWLKANQTGFTPKDWLADMVKAASLPAPTDTEADWVPYNLQLTPAENTSQRFSVALDPKLGSMRKSKLFEVIFDTTKTFTKTLEPGETWEMDYCHYTGPGVKVNDLIITDDLATYATSAAAFYYPMFEIVGKPSEVVDSQNRESSFIATNAGAIQLEFKKYCEIVSADISTANLYDTGTAGGYEADQWAYRVFTDYATTNTDTGIINRRFNVNYTDILKAGEADAAGKYIIPLTSDTAKVRGGRSNDGA